MGDVRPLRLIPLAPLIGQDVLARVYDEVSAAFGGGPGHWVATGLKRRGVATLTRDLLRSWLEHYGTDAIDDLTPWALAAASCDAAYRFGLLRHPWDETTVRGLAEEQMLAFAGALIDRARAEIQERDG